MLGTIILIFLALASAKSQGYTETININLKDEQKVEFLCPTSSDFVLWYRGTEELIGPRITYPFDLSAQIDKLTVADSGEYTCKDPITENVVATFVLNVIPEKKIVVEPIEWSISFSGKIYRRSNAAIILPCRTKSKKTVVKAYKILQDGKRELLKDSGVVLLRPKASDSGKYVCEATRDGISDEKSFELTIRVDGGLSKWGEWEDCDVECGYGYQSRYRTCTNPPPANGGSFCLDEMKQRRRCRARSCSAPKLLKFGFDMTDGNLKLFCEASGIPKPSVLWRRNGRELPKFLNARSPTLVIPESKKRSGAYSCRIQNPSGFFQRYIQVDV